MAKKSMKPVALADLKAKLEAQLDAPSASVGEATVTVTMAPPVEATPSPKPVKRKLTAEEQKRHEEQWEKVHQILVAGIAELVKEGEAALKEEQRLADLKAFHEESYARVQEYWTAELAKIAEEKAKREAARNSEFAQLEAAVRARKARQNAHRDERAQANRDMAKGGSSNGKGGNGNGKKGGKGK